MAGSSLVPFHRVLITAAIAFCAGLSWWMFSMTGRSDSTPYGALGVIFAILAVVLVVYLWNLRRVLGYRDDRDER
jgi:heme/copper-type cytochrome/quinol oxidase subunit 1